MKNLHDKIAEIRDDDDATHSNTSESEVATYYTINSITMRESLCSLE